MYSKKKEFAPSGIKFLLFRVDPFTDGDMCAGEQTGRHKNCLTLGANSFFLENTPLHKGMCADEQTGSQILSPSGSKFFFRT